MNHLTSRAAALYTVASLWLADVRERAASDERGSNTMEYAIIVVAVLAVAGIIAGVIASVAGDKIQGIR